LETLGREKEWQPKSDIFPESHRLGGAGEEALGEVLGGRGGYGSGLGDVAGAILLPTQ